MASEPDRLVDEIRQRRASLAAGLSPFSAVRAGFRRKPAAWLLLGAVVAGGFAAAHYLGPRLAAAGKKSARGWLRRRVGQQAAATVLAMITHALGPKPAADGAGARTNGAARTARRPRRSRARARPQATDPPPQA